MLVKSIDKFNIKCNKYDTKNLYTIIIINIK